MNYQEIIEKLSSKITISEFAHWEVNENDIDNSDEKKIEEEYKKRENILKELKEEFNIEEVEQSGGSDQGSERYSVKHFVNDNIFIKVSGYYSSYEGTVFDDSWNHCKEVFPEQITITIYNSKKVNN